MVVFEFSFLQGEFGLHFSFWEGEYWKAMTEKRSFALRLRDGAARLLTLYL